MADLHTSLVYVDICYGEAVRLSPLVQRVTANNPSPFTGQGTNTYLVGMDQIVVIDPGPNDPEHIKAIIKAGQGKIRWIIPTHTHEDHSPAAWPLAQETGAELIGEACDPNNPQLDKTFVPDRTVADGEILEFGDFSLRVFSTPGHLSPHHCYLLEQEQLLFTGDHVMQGATVVIAPDHGGSMGEYLSSLQKLTGLGIKVLAPAHGHLLSQADQVLTELYEHRIMREKMVLDVLKQYDNATVKDLVPIIYPDLPDNVIPIAYVALRAHLLKLVDDGVVSHQVTETSDDDVWAWLD